MRPITSLLATGAAALSVAGGFLTPAAADTPAASIQLDGCNVVFEILDGDWGYAKLEVTVDGSYHISKAANYPSAGDGLLLGYGNGWMGKVPDTIAATATLYETYPDNPVTFELPEQPASDCPPDLPPGTTPPAHLVADGCDLKLVIDEAAPTDDGLWPQVQLRASTSYGPWWSKAATYPLGVGDALIATEGNGWILGPGSTMHVEGWLFPFNGINPVMVALDTTMPDCVLPGDPPPPPGDDPGNDEGPQDPPADPPADPAPPVEPAPAPEPAPEPEAAPVEATGPVVGALGDRSTDLPATDVLAAETAVEASTATPAAEPARTALPRTGINPGLVGLGVALAGGGELLCRIARRRQEQAER